MSLPSYCIVLFFVCRFVTSSMYSIKNTAFRTRSFVAQYLFNNMKMYSRFIGGIKKTYFTSGRA